MNVVFRVDSSLVIGSGHIIRCLTLANELKNRAARITFVTRLHDGNMSYKALEQGYNVELLEKPNNTNKTYKSKDYSAWLGVNWKKDALETIKKINKIKSNEKIDWLIVDHYALDSRWHNKLRSVVKKIFVIDDLCNRELDCEILLDQTYCRKESEYRDKVPNKCILLLGSKYALLRPEFRHVRKIAFEKRFSIEKINRILVNMGGVDNNNYTKDVLNALSCVNWKVRPKIDVIVGSKYPHSRSLQHLVKSYPFDISISTDVNNMAERMLAADMAVGASGTTTWERCCLGLPTAVICISENQEYIAQQVEASGAIVLVSNEKLLLNSQLVKLFDKLQDNISKLKDMSECCFKIVDGKGALKVVDFMLKN